MDWILDGTNYPNNSSPIPISFSSPYAYLSFLQNNDEYPIPYLTPLEPISLTPPYPYLSMLIDDDYPYPDPKPQDITTLTPPYPYCCLIQKQNEYPKNYTDFDLIFLGAFCNAKNLTSIQIPKTVKKIGEYSFTNTKLTEVTISSDCEYFETSFPPNCIVKFYEN